ncbi:hypothetical protein [Phenylobacterium montanum]|uniref:Carboxypeptidase regulatory-like domain-containing protein n=1 Tax=Phenylobacterium montanum TaxID=2823693 RepID=A0A975IUN7_9CAUL|nr:hypothetical protein [Caulobacter sp. S6]QUD87930.1 hypothetical protein KCG34_23305 [Caulobacter sp. S6]
MSRASYTLLFALLLAGCETVGPSAPSVSAPPPPPPPTMEYGSITGFGAFHTASGALATCAGQSVALMAATPGARARMTALYGSASHAMTSIATVKARAAKAPPSTEPLVDSTQCAADGRFAFSNLKAGIYFVVTRVRLDHPVRGQEEFAVMQEVPLRLGETQQVRLTP